MSTRTHFVYRVFDEFGLLLYVGCTKNPPARFAQHRAERALWLPYMAGRVRMEGPFVKRDGFARESLVIEDERPFFNALSEHRRVKLRRRTMGDRMMRDLRRRRPDLFPASGYDPVVFAEFQREHDHIAAQVDAAIPDVDDAWRHANYLSARRREAVKSA